MKTCKVKIEKKRVGIRCDFIYPPDYDVSILSPFMYQDEGKDEEYCLATVPDDFKFTDAMVEVTKEDAEKDIDSWAVSNINNKKDVTAEELTTIKNKRKAWLT